MSINIEHAVEQLYTIARQIDRRDPTLAEKIRECAEALNKHPGWVDDKLVDDLRKAGGL